MIQSVIVKLIDFMMIKLPPAEVAIIVVSTAKDIQMNSVLLVIQLMILDKKKTIIVPVSLIILIIMKQFACDAIIHANNVMDPKILIASYAMLTNLEIIVMEVVSALFNITMIHQIRCALIVITRVLLAKMKQAVLVAMPH